jgi:hypothetical protein
MAVVCTIITPAAVSKYKASNTGRQVLHLAIHGDRKTSVRQWNLSDRSHPSMYSPACLMGFNGNESIRLVASHRFHLDLLGDRPDGSKAFCTGPHLEQTSRLVARPSARPDVRSGHSDCISVSCDNCLLEVPCGDVLLGKQDVELFKGTLTSFWQAEVRPDQR